MTRIPVVEQILSANDALAEDNRKRLRSAGVFSINVMASPGAGKTSLIEETIKGLGAQYRVAVIEGDIATQIDAERVEKAGAISVQINTGGGCHLEAASIKNALDNLPLLDIDLLIIENVGNLVCPSNWRLGAEKRVLVASVPEGDDKPYKYPGMYRGIDTLVINKVDLLPHTPFDMAYFRRGVESLNPGVAVYPISCRTGEGFGDWISWLKKQMNTTDPNH